MCACEGTEMLCKICERKDDRKGNKMKIKLDLCN